MELPSDRREQRLEQLVRMLHIPVTLDDDRAVDGAASVGAAAPASVGSRDLAAFQRSADAALYDGKDTGARPSRPASTSPCRPLTAAGPTVRARPRGGGPHEQSDPARGRLDPRTQHQAAWTTAILTGAKTIENRTRAWRLGWVLQHASKSLDQPTLRTPLIARTILSAPELAAELPALAHRQPVAGENL
nr:hypothetical protein [Streptomyces subrutilus]